MVMTVAMFMGVLVDVLAGMIIGVLVIVQMVVVLLMVVWLVAMVVATSVKKFDILFTSGTILLGSISVARSKVSGLRMSVVRAKTGDIFI